MATQERGGWCSVHVAYKTAVCHRGKSSLRPRNRGNDSQRMVLERINSTLVGEARWRLLVQSMLFFWQPYIKVIFRVNGFLDPASCQKRLHAAGYYHCIAGKTFFGPLQAVNAAPLLVRPGSETVNWFTSTILIGDAPFRGRSDCP